MADQLISIVSDEGNYVADVDSSYLTLGTKTNEEKSLGDGDSYIASYSVDMALGSSHYGILTTPNTTDYFWLTFEIDVEKETKFSIYESVTVSSSLAGTALTIYNRNRPSSNTSSGLAYYGPTVTDVTLGTTIIYTAYWDTSIYQTKKIPRFKLNSNTKYAFVIQNGSTTAASYTGYAYYWDEK